MKPSRKTTTTTTTMAVPVSSNVTGCATKRKRERTSYHLIVDGCNGPIRFREQDLALTIQSSSDKEKKIRNASISILNCYTQENTSKRKGAKYMNRGTNQSDIRDTTATVFGAATYQRLDILPLMEQILQNKDSPLEEVTVIFDGISMTKRPSLQGQRSKNESNFQCVEMPELARREYHVSDHIRVEITGIYDEGDNVIMEKVEFWQQHQQVNSQQCRQGQREVIAVSKDLDHSLSKSLERKLFISSPRQQNGPSNSNDCFDTNATTVSHKPSILITVVHRSDQGPGRARTILQPLGLLRPESVLCLFESGFGSAALELAKMSLDQSRRSSSGPKYLLMNHPHVFHR
jgi:hypothetical protein